VTTTAGESALRGVIVAHGEMATGLVNAVSRITGLEEGVLHPVSNEGRSPDQLQEAILSRLGDGAAVVFTDLAAGSCTLAARLSCRDRRRVAVVTGVNLPMLLEFVFHREMTFDELLPRLEDKARAGIRVLARPANHVDSTVPD
jgi:mannose/fructose-specific phosphotransferase system component IIA